MQQDQGPIDSALSMIGGKATPRRVLLAEDDAAMRSLITDWLAGAGHTVVACSSAEEMVDHILWEAKGEFLGEDRRAFDLIITDLHMPGRDGLDALEGLWAFPLPPIILITAYGDEEIRERAARLNVGAVLFKPFSYGDLMLTAEWLSRSRPD